MQSEWQASEKYPSASVHGAAPVSREEGTLNLNRPYAGTQKGRCRWS